MTILKYFSINKNMCKGLFRFFFSGPVKCVENKPAMSVAKLNDYQGFKEVLHRSNKIVVLTGAGMSTDSGIPDFRGVGGLWRTHNATELASLNAFRRNPSLVWEFYHYRRTVAFKAKPNKGHIALAQFENECRKNGRQFHIITQNVDGLHTRAGSQNVVELHGNLIKIRCTNTKCKLVKECHDHPIVEALRDRGDPGIAAKKQPDIDISELPRCSTCNSLARPNIVWFGENLDPEVLVNARELAEKCDLCLVIGTSLNVFPAAELAPLAADKGKPVAEFNLNDYPSRLNFQFVFSGHAGVTVPKALGYENL